ncbi:hypothetical protein [Devosia nitrariae]|uniref:Uncharacterized protein n=1 Tax=Devosia nitrariae TaxID=2071872 RepID=A0ABQ5W6E0_9HYPH|nr:hypothetical protein [Devosia nitrariae]GLQ55364.1 hypothetical protein GCM10010862_26230 [Devosia nitrariae]
MLMNQKSRRFAPYLLLLAGAFVLVVLFFISLHVTLGGLAEESVKRLLDLNGEGNLPAWYGSFLWLIGAYHAREAALLTKQLERARPESAYWIALCVGCCLLSLDEVASIHENIGAFIDYGVGNPEGYAPVYNWVWVGLVVVALALLAFLRFLFRLPRQTALGLVAAGAVFLMGAIGMETFGSRYEYAERFPFGLNWNKVIALEEFLEMAGAILFSLVVRMHIERMAGLRTASAHAIGKAGSRAE